MNDRYLNKDIYGENIRRFCMNVDERWVSLFKNLRFRIVNLVASYEQLLPKLLEDQKTMKIYQDVIEKYDKVLNIFRYGLEYMNQLIAIGEKTPINRWDETLKEFKEVCWFLEHQEELLKQRCKLKWNDGFGSLVEEGKLSPYYTLVSVELPNGFWYEAVTNPVVTAHVILEETLKSLKANTGGMMYKIAIENLIIMSPVYGEYGMSQKRDDEKCFQFPEIEKMLF